MLVSSADRPFKCDEETFNPARPDAALDFDRGDRPELPALSSMLVEHLLELVAGHLAADHALSKLDHRVLVAVRHATTIAAASARDRTDPTWRRGRATTLLLPVVGKLMAQEVACGVFPSQPP
jgi:hypothetical protein